MGVCLFEYIKIPTEVHETQNHCLWLGTHWIQNL